MKVLHTSDWHLGARLGRHSRHPDHLAALQGLIAVAEAERPDLVLHTGDLFDSARPAHESLELAVHALRRLANLAPTIVLCGNHDSPSLFNVLHDLAGLGPDRGLWFLARPQVVALDVAGGRVAVACIPFVSPAAITDVARGDMESFEGSYADGINEITMQLLSEAEQCAGSAGVVLFAAHLHVHGAVPGGSEKRISVGEDYATHGSGLHRARYSAFGHIHDPQLLPGATRNGRYAGSLIPIDFGEQAQVKQVVLVDLGDDVATRAVDLPRGRPLTRIDGDLNTLMSRAADGGLDHHLLRARIATDDPVPDLVDQLLMASPHCAVFDLVNVVRNRNVRPIDASAAPEAEPSLSVSFMEWRTTSANAGQRRAPDQTVIELLEQSLGGSADTRPELGTERLTARVNAALHRLAEA